MDSAEPVSTLQILTEKKNEKKKMNSIILMEKKVECCFTSTETVGLLGMGALDGHLDFHTAPELWQKIC